MDSEPTSKDSQRSIYLVIKHLWWNFLAKIVNEIAKNFSKKLRLRRFIGFWSYLWVEMKMSLPKCYYVQFKMPYDFMFYIFEVVLVGVILTQYMKFIHGQEKIISQRQSTVRGKDYSCLLMAHFLFAILN